MRIEAEMIIVEKHIELENCGFCKAILMLFIVFYHVILPWTGNQMNIQSDGLKYCAYWLNTFHIYAFALISGYIYCYYKLENGKYGAFGAFIKKKAKRLLIPYLFLSILWVGPIEAAMQQYGLEGFIHAQLLCAQPQQLWFLIMLFGVFVLFYPLTNFFKENDLGGLLVCVALYCAGTVGNRFLDDYFQIWQICRFTLFFWLGFKLRQNGSKIIYRIPSLVYLIFDLVLFALTYLIPINSLVLNVFRSGLFMLTCVVGSVGAFVILQRIANRVQWKKSSTILTLLKYSMPVYLIHQQVTYLLSIKLNGVISPYLQVPINFVFTMYVSLALAAFLYRFATTRKLLGEKN